MIGFASSATPGGAEGGEAASESKEGGEHATLTPITFEGASCLIKILNTKQTTACNLSVVRMVYFFVVCVYFDSGVASIFLDPHPGHQHFHHHRDQLYCDLVPW